MRTTRTRTQTRLCAAEVLHAYCHFLTGGGDLGPGGRQIGARWHGHLDAALSSIGRVLVALR
ncbi:hypothetical protein ACWEWG_38425 [Streptomyces sp. NPDC003758]